jgi:hypothetical protein
MSDQNTDAAMDRQYRLGFEQAWREWSSIVQQRANYPNWHEARGSDVRRMEERLREIQGR